MHTLLFGVIPGPDIQTAEQLTLEAKPHVDGIELRLDSFTNLNLVDLQSLLRRAPLPIMLTVRRGDQGGEYKGTEEERLALLEALCPLAPAYLDLEYDVPEDFRKRLFETYPKIIFLSSYHDVSSTPDDLIALYNKVRTPYAHITKLVTTALVSSDALRMLLLVQGVAKLEKIIGICMGQEGTASRILAPVVGNYLTYAALSIPTAPGQLTAKELQDTYHFRTLTPQTAIYALVGRPIDQSLGALIHNALFEQLHINAIYIKLAVKTEDLTAFFALALQLSFKGFSITMPHKESVIPLLAQSSAQVQKISSCNTIAVLDHKMIGFNTDASGALDAIEQRETVRGKRLLFIGAGGSAKALIFEAVERGAHVIVINRTAERAIEIAKAVVGGQGGGFELLPQVCAQGYDMIVNCTPSDHPIEEQYVLPETIAMDLVYVPKHTPFLLLAARKNCRLVFGYEMFINQALGQQRIWGPSGLDVDRGCQIIQEVVGRALIYTPPTPKM